MNVAELVRKYNKPDEVYKKKQNRSGTKLIN